MTNPVPPPGEGLGNVLFEVWLVSRATTALITDAIREAGLDADEFAVYSVLASTDGMTPTELAHWMAAPATTVSSYLKRFAARGHVERVHNIDDRRSYMVRLTDAGRVVHEAAGSLFLPVLAQIDGLLGPDLTDTRERLRSLHAALVPDPRAPDRSVSIGGGGNTRSHRTPSSSYRKR
jgi:DNA-binding MarR family transcriptional regulator